MLRHTGQNCTMASRAGAVAELRGVGLQLVGPGERQWLFQTCTEFGYCELRPPPAPWPHSCPPPPGPKGGLQGLYNPLQGSRCPLRGLYAHACLHCTLMCEHVCPPRMQRLCRARLVHAVFAHGHVGIHVQVRGREHPQALPHVCTCVCLCVCTCM